MWRKLFKPFASVLGYELVMLKYYDYEAQIRFAKVLPSGIYVKGIYTHFLLPRDGGGRSYIKEWYRL